MTFSEKFHKAAPWVTIGLIASFCFILLYAVALSRPTRAEAAEGCGLQAAFVKWERVKARIEKVNPKVNSSEAADAIITAADNHRVNVYLLAAMFEVESRYSSLAIGKAKEGGMAQIHPKTAADLKVDYATLSNPYISADVGAMYFARHLAAYSTVKGAVVRYNGGGDPEYAEKVMLRYLEITGEFLL